MRYYILLFLWPLVFSQFISAQEPGYQQVRNAEKKLIAAFDALYDNNSPDKDSINNYIMKTFGEILRTWDGFYYQWPGLKKVGIVRSKDQKTNIFTWYLKKDEDKYQYYGFIQYRSGKRKKKKNIHVHQLKDQSQTFQNPRNAKTTKNQWFGCLYYDIQKFSDRKHDYYALLGYDFNNRLSTMKLVEILSFDRNGNPDFGAKIHVNGKIQQRYINEYSSELLISQEYDPKLDMIVFDHLEPFQPIFEGNYSFYGPVGSYDALRFDDGAFYLEKDVDARNL